MIGRSVRRLEDPRRLRGEGVYVDDVHVPGMLHATVVRSPHAHARLREIDAAAAREAPGIAAVFTAGDLMDALRPIPIRLVPDDRLLRYLQHPLAVDRVRYVGEPVALVVARSRAAAEDAAERVEVGFEPLPRGDRRGAAAAPPPSSTTPRTTSPRSSRRASGTSTPRSRGRTGSFGSRSVPGAIPRCRWRPGDSSQRRTGAPPTAGGRLTIWGPTKVTHFNRGVLAAMLGWPEHRIRLVEPEVGGGFGARGEFYPEDFLVPCAALRLGRPVKWIEDRVEHLSAINHSREQCYELALALDPDGRFLGLRAEMTNDMGAYLRTHGTGGAGAERRHAPRPVRDGGVPVPGALRAHQQDPDRHLPRPPAVSSAMPRANGSSIGPPG